MYFSAFYKFYLSEFYEFIHVNHHHKQGISILISIILVIVSSSYGYKLS